MLTTSHTRALPPTSPVAFVHALRVYWEDTDAGGVVFYANYLKFFERARTEWLRALGLQQQALRDATELIFVVTQTHVRYKAPARLDDLLQISVELTRCGGASMAFAQQARCGPLLLAEGQIDVACVDGVSFKPRRLPKEFAPLLLQPKAL